MVACSAGAGDNLPYPVEPSDSTGAVGADRGPSSWRCGPPEAGVLWSRPTSLKLVAKGRGVFPGSNRGWTPASSVPHQFLSPPTKNSLCCLARGGLPVLLLRNVRHSAARRCTAAREVSVATALGAPGPRCAASRTQSLVLALSASPSDRAAFW